MFNKPHGFQKVKFDVQIDESELAMIEFDFQKVIVISNFTFICL